MEIVIERLLKFDVSAAISLFQMIIIWNASFFCDTYPFEKDFYQLFAEKYKWDDI